MDRMEHCKGAMVTMTSVAMEREKEAAGMSDINYTYLDPGIRETVRWLRSLSFDTCDSGDGVSKPFRNLDVPHVFIQVDPANLVAEADNLARYLADRGIKIEPQRPDESTPAIHANYDPANGSATLVLIGINDAMLATTRPSTCSRCTGVEPNGQYMRCSEDKRKRGITQRYRLLMLPPSWCPRRSRR